LLVTIVGWYILHFFSGKRDFKNKKKEIRINYLIEVWRKLNDVSNREKTKVKQTKRIEATEQIVADIQLFGTKKQVELIEKILAGLKEQPQISLDDLLDDLRQSLREELGLDKITGKVHFFRIKE